MVLGVGAFLGGAAIGAAAGLIGGRASDRSNTRIANQNIAYQKEFAQQGIQWRTEDAQAAGVHPLYAMGANTTSFQNNQPTGSRAGDALAMSGRQFTRANLDLIAANVELTRAKTAQIESNAQQDVIYNGIGDRSRRVVKPGLNPNVQELEKGRVQPHVKAHPEQNLSVLSPMTTFRMGSQKVRLPIEEMDQAMEDPVAVAVAAYFYHGNKDVNWRKLILEYTGSSTGTAMHNRNPAAFRAGARFARALNKVLKKYHKPSPPGYYNPRIPKPRRR